MTSKSRHRRGVLLLVVLSLLVIFLLIGVTFVVIANQHSAAAKSANRAAQDANDPRALLDDAMYQLLRDTKSPASKLKDQSLLGDLYGSTGVGDSADGDVVVGNNRSISGGGQFLDIDVAGLSQPREFYEGLVLTFVSGKLKGISTRILPGGAPAQSASQFRVLATDLPRDPAGNPVLPEPRDRLRINGRPFTGDGLNANPNEDYDAADELNMFLGAIIPPDGANPKVRVIPSFDRTQTQMTPPNTLRLRPVDPPWHPQTNPYPWDVDNDGDGNKDSVWIDAGFPPESTPDGRLYRPLVAFLCIDLDGRLNLNAHGSNDHLVQRPQLNVPLAGRASLFSLPRGQGYGPPEIHLGDLLSFDFGLFRLMRGGEDITSRRLYVTGRYGQDVPVQTPPRRADRLDDQYPGIPDGVVDRNGDGRPDYDELARVKFLGHPPRYTDLPYSLFSSPIDLKGQFAYGLDWRGQPRYEAVAYEGLNQAFRHDINTAYELNLGRSAPQGWSQGGAPDMPFSAAELERILRVYDADAGNLPPRLWELLPAFRTDPGDEPFTIASGEPFNDVNANGMYDPAETFTDTNNDSTYDFGEPFNDANGNGAYDDAEPYFDANADGNYDAGSSIPDMNGNVRPDRGAAENRLLATTQSFDLPVPGVQAYAAIGFNPDLISPDVAMGLRMDINRPFGNGQDDGPDRNFVVDDHTEIDTDFVWDQVAGAGFPASPTRPSGPLKPDRDNDGTLKPYVAGTVDEIEDAKALFARHLYVLLMMVKGNGTEINFDGNAINDSPAETAKGLAEWAVNVVDFRDADSIMTGFAYDVDPLDGWEPDDVVWGCERPELLITETLAFHDRRTEDRGEDTEKLTSDNDDDFDQRLRPRGSLFVELYNPWTDQEKLPGEFYYDRRANGLGQGGIRLDQLSRDGDSPVWRLIVIKGESRRDPTSVRPDPQQAGGQTWAPRDPDDPARSGFQVTDIERSIYFVDLGIAGPVPLQGTNFYTDIPHNPVLPGRYAVIGSSGKRVGNRFVTTVGWRSDATDTDLKINTTRRIELIPDIGIGINSNQVGLSDNSISTPPRDGDGNPLTLEGDIQPAVAVAINLPRSVSISEPVGGYGLYDGGRYFNPSAVSGEGEYQVDVANPMPNPIDKPLDYDRIDLTDPRDKDALETDGTTPDFRVLHLQRLANPLKPYDPDRNPYLTIDTMRVHLTVFNGTMDEDVQDPSPNLETGRHTFESIQRGGDRPNGLMKDRRLLWSYQWPRSGQLSESNELPPGAPTNYNLLNYRRELVHTLGYLNGGYGPRYESTSMAPNIPGPNSYGDPELAAQAGSPFPWLTWNNRPFVSHFELLLVPRNRSSRLVFDFTTATSITAPPVDPFPAFGHLINFFGTTDGSRTFRRLLEYVHVPSRFVGTETVLNPSVFDASTGRNVKPFYVPFNKVSQYREPGKVNINTIYSERIWDAIVHNLPGMRRHSGPWWQELVASRRGYDARDSQQAWDIMAAPAGNQQSFFTKPFRTLDAPNASDTLLRELLPAMAGNPRRPLFERIRPSGPHNDPDRNAVFRYQGLTRIGNLVTTRSNVFAVWITLGYFEVGADGTTLTGQELGADTGDVDRHRAFYMIDRSIPVAFEPGVNHNVDDAVLVRRFIK